MPPKIPTYDHLMNPLVIASAILGVAQDRWRKIYNKVVELESFLEDSPSQLHDSENSNDTEIEYRLAWARTYSKKYGLLDNSSRGVWSLNAKGLATEKLIIKRLFASRAMDKKGRAELRGSLLRARITRSGRLKQRLIAILIQKLSPAAFERLVQPSP